MLFGVWACAHALVTYALGTGTLSWFGRDCSGKHTQTNTNIIMIWGRFGTMLWYSYALGT